MYIYINNNDHLDINLRIKNQIFLPTTNSASNYIFYFAGPLGKTVSKSFQASIINYSATVLAYSILPTLFIKAIASFIIS